MSVEETKAQPTLVTSNMALGQMPNPYEFAHPVTQAARFAGRNRELEDIKYYLNLATQVAQPVNLALIGERASGKTSLLNMIEIQAQDTGLLTSRINLNSGDAEPIRLFWKLYDAVVESVTAAGFLFRPGSGEDIVYRRIIDRLETSADSPEFPLRFPAHYAASINGGRQISESKLQRDLSYIHKQTGKACVLLFDECNVLTQNRVALEMLRNVFMATPGYMLVLTGTPTFFPLLDDVFSPIIRQFKKIVISAFSKREETESCMSKPLRTLGIDPSRIMRPYWRLSYDIHAISGGRPYEIQLLCHLMFRRIQEDRAKRMELTADVIDDVLRELETSNTTDRPVISAIRRTTKRQLQALRVFGQSSGHVTLEQAWFLNCLVPEEPAVSHGELSAALNELRALGLLNVDADGKVSFSGDEFEQTYVRYHAERAGISLSITNMPYAASLGIQLSEALESFTGPVMISSEDDDFSEPSPIQALSLLFDPQAGEITEQVTEVYRSVVAAMPSGKLTLTQITLNYDGVEASGWVSFPGDSYVDLSQSSDLLALKRTVEDNSGTLASSEHTFILPPAEEIVERVLASGNMRLIRRLGSSHTYAATAEYFAGGRDAALINCDYAAKFPLSADDLNTVGYVNFGFGERGTARDLFDRAIESALKSDDYRSAALAMFNRGVVDFMAGDRHGAIAALQAAKVQHAGHDDEPYNLRCLFVPTIIEERIMMKESVDPELFAMVDETLAFLENCEDGYDTPTLNRSCELADSD